MFEWAGPAMDTLWHNGFAAIPFVLVAAAASRFLPCLPATRHLIWVTVLIWLVGSSLLPQAPVGLIDNSSSDHFASSKVVEAPQVAGTISDAFISAEESKPRRLTSHLAKQEATKQVAEASPASKHPSLARTPPVLRPPDPPNHYRFSSRLVHELGAGQRAVR